MIGHLVIAVLVFAGVLGPIELYCEWSHGRERRRRDELTRERRRRRQEQTLAVLERTPGPTPWGDDPWTYRGLGERIAR